MRKFNDKLLLTFFILSITLISFTYGTISFIYQLWPQPPIWWLVGRAAYAVQELKHQQGVELPWYSARRDHAQRVLVHRPERISPGLTLVTGVGGDRRMFARVIDADGSVLHAWSIDWFEMWPDPAHLTERERPEGLPGSFVHGLVLLPEGDVVFNFERLGLVRADACGEIVWRLPYRTHHSVHRDESGTFWVPATLLHESEVGRFPRHTPPFQEKRVLEVSADGEILRDFSIFEILQKNGLTGLLYLSSTHNSDTSVGGDTLHLNDVETFPSSLPEGRFRRGDILVSLRNINTLMVFDPETLEVKFLRFGQTVRQHDPDFIDGDTISVLDNNNLREFDNTAPGGGIGSYSRIVTLSTRDDTVDTVFRGSSERPFYTDIMGKHQRLPNGNILITEARNGRVLEIDAAGNAVWEYNNITGDKEVGVLSEAVRLPARFDRRFFARLAEDCRPGA